MAHKLKITRVPDTGQLGPAWDVPEIPEHLVGLVETPEPDAVTYTDPDTDVETTYRISDLVTEVHEGITTRDLDRTMWAKAGGYPPGAARLRAPAFEGEPLAERLEVSPPKWKPTKALARRKAAVARLGSPMEKQLVQAEEDLEREAFAAWLEERRSRGPA